MNKGTFVCACAKRERFLFLHFCVNALRECAVFGAAGFDN